MEVREHLLPVVWRDEQSSEGLDHFRRIRFRLASGRFYLAELLSPDFFHEVAHPLGGHSRFLQCPLTGLLQLIAALSSSSVIHSHHIRLIDANSCVL